MRNILAIIFVVLMTIYTIRETVAVEPPAKVKPSPPVGSVYGHDIWTLCRLKTAAWVTMQDASYYLPTVSTWRMYVTIPDRKYVADRWDCDDFALETWLHARLLHSKVSTNRTGIAVGFIAYGRHAANVVVLSDHTIFIWDAQDKKIVPWSEAKEVHYIIF